MSQYPKVSTEERAAKLLALLGEQAPKAPTFVGFPSGELTTIATVLYLRGIITAGRYREEIREDLTRCDAMQWQRFIDELDKATKPKETRLGEQP